MRPGLQLRISHQLAMTPQLQQAIRLLQLSSVDLQTEIQEALENNAMLELQESPSENKENECENNIDEFKAQWDTTRSIHPHLFGLSHGNEVETLNSTQTTLQDHLLWQMQLTPFTDTDKFIAITIIDATNEDGFLACTWEEILATTQQVCDVEESEVEAVLHRIQRFDPLGVASRNLSECLKIQLNHLPVQFPWKNKATELVTHHLELLARRDYPALKRRLGLSLEDLKKVILCIQSLHPRPGTTFGNRPPEYIVPDVYTFKKQGFWHVELNPECTPQLSINQHYAALVRHSDSSTDNQFLRHQLQEARWFLKSIENRNTTLLKVASAIVEQQQAFLDYGEEAMKPLILHDIASMLEMHESTISRVTTQKYLHTPRGTFELKYFFSSHVGTDTGGECSAIAICALIKKLIAAENHKKPLSDCKLAQLLANQGIQIARRTIAKYREGMTIPPSNERKQLI